jgi:DNA-binding FadR family transcriptional regulator
VEDRAFHQTLYRVLENRSLNALLDIFWVVFHTARIKTITTDLRPTTTVQDHRSILAAVMAKDTALAQRCIQEHFRNLEERIDQARLVQLPR